MTSLEQVVPNSLNYTDIKPQAIENEIKLVKFQPTSTITGAKGGDMVKFLLSGNGFLDPYSTYFQFTVECNDMIAGELRWLDRSAHSFFQRIIIRSQGVEIERIENYDIIAAMINDMVYSPEQASLHYWEGFPRHSIQLQDVLPGTYTYVAPGVLLNQGSSPSEYSYVGEPCFSQQPGYYQQAQDTHDIATPMIVDLTHAGELGIPQGNLAGLYGTTQLRSAVVPQIENGAIHPLTFTVFDSHKKGKRISRGVIGNGTVVKAVTPVTKMQFIVPIYSGILGLLMPEKKLIPLNLLPLDIEIVFNPHALYSSGTPANTGSRAYTITKFNLMANMQFFEQEIHRTLEASVADHGLFLYCNSFHTAPTQLISGDVPPSVAYISMNLKSINSVHNVFLYNHFETSITARKLHFVSHNLNKLQLLNGTQLIPQYAIEGSAGTSEGGEHLPYIVELYKAWNKMHDPTTDGAICAWNFCGDEYANQFDPLYVQIGDVANQRFLLSLLNKQGLVGRCQYGISLEGEELGTSKTMITGRKSQYPFLLQLGSDRKCTTHTSYMYTFLRADFIVYIRPDLQIVTLGK